MKSNIYKSIFILLFWIILGNAQVPTFTLRSLEGDRINMEERFEKGPVILEFWATWCKPCVKSLPKLQKTWEKYQDHGLQVFAINQDGPRSMSKVGPFINSLGLTFPVLLDENRDVMRKFKAQGLPTTLLIDQNRELVLTLDGYRPGDEKKLEQEIEKLIGKHAE